MGKKKKVYIKTFGCQMNENDSEKMLILLKDEYEPVSSPEDADLILINTCSVRKKPEHKVYSEAGRYKNLKKKKPHLILGITGCVAQQEGENIIKKLPYVDLVLGTQGFYHIKSALRLYQKTKKPVVFTQLKDDFCSPLILPSKDLYCNRITAFVSIMQGCDNFCTYCIVPYVRGREISRPPEDIIQEIETLVKLGVKEVTLLGQNVNSYGLKNKNYPTFPELIKMIAQIKGLLRIRFTTSHPKDLSEELIKVIAEEPKVCKHIHLPLQSGSNRILKKMNRKYTKEEYLAKIKKLRELVPEIAFTTDIIVGFPGESMEDFYETVEVLEKVRYHEIFSFKYCDRPFTPAGKFSEKVPEEEKDRRLKILHEVQGKITQEIYQSYVGKDVEVLVEGRSKRDPEWLSGRTTTNVIVNFSQCQSISGKDLKGKLVKVKITYAGKHSLKGDFLEEIKTEQ